MNRLWVVAMTAYSEHTSVLCDDQNTSTSRPHTSLHGVIR